MSSILQNQIFNIDSRSSFEAVALNVFDFQYHHNEVYQRFCNFLKRHPENVRSLSDIPFLPISFFKSHKVVSGNAIIKKHFKSSGTTGTKTSTHYVSDLNLYQKSFLKGFIRFYGPVDDYVFLGLLPSYLEREDSSLVYMVNQLIIQSKHKASGFYLDDLKSLTNKILELEKRKQKTILIGVSFALLDLIEKQHFNLEHTIIMETGGMKGKRKELVKEALHNQLKNGFGVDKVHSEYGMTELLSQAYSKGEGKFLCPAWMKIMVRDPQDALSLTPKKAGGINIIDLANINSCSFIATQDLGKVFPDNSFEILGRFDHSDIRGCNLMVI